MDFRSKPREIELRYQGKAIRPGGVFELFYRGLDLLILNNWDALSVSTSVPNEGSQDGLR